MDLLNTEPEWKHLIRSEGLSTLDPAAAQSSNASPEPLASMCVCVFGGWVLREHSEQDFCAVFSGPEAPWEEAPACTCRFQLCLIRIFTSAAHTRTSHISHTSRTPLAEDTHTHAHACTAGSLSAVVGVRCYTHIKSANLMRSLSSNIRFLNGGHS